jgi:hypothetical protein
MTRALRTVVLGALLGATAARAEAGPIAYLGQLQPGVPVAEANTQTAVNEDNPVGADYWYFHATAGTPVSVIGRRESGHYDMAFWILQGLFADDSVFGSLFDSGDASFALFGDDEAGPNVPGPFGDPRAAFVAPATGYYTVAVTNFLSEGPPPNLYSLEARGITVPEPAMVLLMGVGIVAHTRTRRRVR